MEKWLKGWRCFRVRWRFQTLKISCCSENLESCGVCTMSPDTTEKLLPETEKGGGKDLPSPLTCSLTSPNPPLVGKSAGIMRTYKYQASLLFPLGWRREERGSIHTLARRNLCKCKSDPFCSLLKIPQWLIPRKSEGLTRPQKTCDLDSSFPGSVSHLHSSWLPALIEDSHIKQ